MKKMKIAALLLALLMIFGTLAACAGTGDPSETLPAGSDPSQTEKDDSKPDLPPMTFDGYTFGMVHWYLAKWGMHSIDLYAEDLTSDPINDAVYTRNTRLSESLDISFEFEEVPQNEINQVIRQAIRSNDDFYDLYYVRLYDVSGVLLEGSFLDFNYDIPYINLDKPYWDQSIRKQISINDHLFMTACDINVIDKTATDGILFNKQIARDYEMPNFYDMVKKGEWTLEEFHKLMTSFDGDRDGDGKLDPNVDVLGYLGQNDVFLSTFYGGGGHFTVKDQSDLPVFDFNTEENIDLVTRILDMMYEPSFANAHVDGNPLNAAFRAGNGLFYWTRLDGVVSLRTDENIDFGVLPTPKNDELQEDYIAMISQYNTGLPSILTCESDVETVGYIMEAMAGASAGLQNAYYDITLKTKSARDDESQDMLDIIFAHRVLDIGELCQFGNFPATFLSFPTEVGGYCIVSKYESAEKSIEDGIEAFLEAVDKIDELRNQ